MERERVRLTEVVHEGSFGRIYKGWLQREHPELDQQVSFNPNSIKNETQDP